MTRIVTRAALTLSGAMLAAIGGALLVSPAAFLAMSHVHIDPDPGLLSELTAPSGALIITGTLMIFAAIKLKLANLALSAGAIVYASYGVGRLVSMALHGLPSDPLIAATIIELAVAAILMALRVSAPS